MYFTHNSTVATSTVLKTEPLMRKTYEYIYSTSISGERGCEAHDRKLRSEKYYIP